MVPVQALLDICIYVASVVCTLYERDVYVCTLDMMRSPKFGFSVVISSFVGGFVS